MFIILLKDYKETKRGRYVAPPGQEHSYTDKLEKARVFTVEKHARQNCCENETVVPLESVLEGLEGLERDY
jgi:hypothetical protein